MTELALKINTLERHVGSGDVAEGAAAPMPTSSGAVASGGNAPGTEDAELISEIQHKLKSRLRDMYGE